MTGLVYFLRPIGAEGPIKIGCSEMPSARLKNYAPWSPVMLEIAATIPGDFSLERRLHSRFISDHLHHEWFAASPGLLRIIAEAQAGTFDPAKLPELNNPSWRLHNAGNRWISDEGLECAQLSKAIKVVREERGYQAPPPVTKALQVLRKDADGDPDEARQLIQAFLAEPTRLGVPIAADWAARKRQRAAA